MLLNHPCKIPIFFAYFMIAYCVACTYYLLTTRDLGTPFMDSLSEEQTQIKKDSTFKRKKAFITGLIIGAILLFIFKPFVSK
jgi:hypothetical protein